MDPGFSGVIGLLCETDNLPAELPGVLTSGLIVVPLPKLPHSCLSPSPQLQSCSWSWHTLPRATEVDRASVSGYLGANERPLEPGGIGAIPAHLFPCHKHCRAPSVWEWLSLP